ncbi:MAG: hypothetical protein E7490_01855 [Ruminococcaceae bacterium]|nr:hypothetical protein [Oscillospiraceae bacterium]
MDDVKSVLLGICLLTVATGILKILIPETKFKTQISFLVSCIFAISLISSFDEVSVFTSFDFTNLQKTEVIDFSEKLSEQVRVESAKAVRLKVEELLKNNDFSFQKVYVFAHINGAFCISITEIEILFSDTETEDRVKKAIELVSREVGSDIIVKYGYLKI